MRFFGLSVLTLALAGRAHAIAVFFTPVVGPVPDVIVGDRALISGSGGPSPNDVFEHPEAFDIFDYVAGFGGNSGEMPTFVSDEDLIYRFALTPVAPPPGTDGVSDARYSINGVRLPGNGSAVDLTAAVVASPVLTFRDEAFSVNGDAATPEIQGSLTYDVCTGGARATAFGRVIDSAAVTLEISTTGFSQTATGDFFIYTVNDAPDSLSGGASGLGCGLPVPVSLANWGHSGSNLGGGGLPPPVTPGPPPRGGITPDDDGSIVDLSLLHGDFDPILINTWSSPAGIIPFADGGTYRFDYRLETDIASAANVPRTRLLVQYNGNLGTHDHNVHSVAGAPSAEGTDYVAIVDLLDVAGADADLGGGVIENGLQLQFQTVDFEIASVGGGAVTLDWLTVTALDRSALLAGAVTELDVTDFTDTSQVVPGGFSAGNPATVSTEVESATITSALAQGEGFQLGPPLEAITFAGNVEGVNIIPFTPSVTQNAVYRFEAEMDASGVTGSSVIAQIQTFESVIPSPRVTNEVVTTGVRPQQGSTPSGSLGPAATLSAYIAGRDLISDATGNPGTLIAGNVALLDTSDTVSDTLVVTGMRIQSFPENLLP